MKFENILMVYDDDYFLGFSDDNFDIFEYVISYYDYDDEDFCLDILRGVVLVFLINKFS